MKLLTLNFLTCAIKTCKTSPSSFPLHPQDAELEIVESDVNMAFLRNILPRLMWEELRGITRELGLPELPETAPAAEDLVIPQSNPAPVSPFASATPASSTDDASQLVAPAQGEPSQVAKDLHRLLLETSIREGKLVCGNCGHEYAVKEGIANFLLPGHLV